MSFQNPDLKEMAIIDGLKLDLACKTLELTLLLNEGTPEVKQMTMQFRLVLLEPSQAPHLDFNPEKEVSSRPNLKPVTKEEIRELADFMKSLAKAPTDPKYLPGSDLVGVHDLIHSELYSDKPINSDD